MKNVIKITKCDDQLRIIATNGVNFYQVAEVGNGPDVDFNVSLVEGAYIAPKSVMNPTGPVNDTVCLPAGTYDIYYSGFNMTGPYNYEFSLNGSTYKLLNGQGDAKIGFIWNLGDSQPSSIKVVIG
jgi:hypothetical protein